MLLLRTKKHEIDKLVPLSFFQNTLSKEKYKIEDPSFSFWLPIPYTFLVHLKFQGNIPIQFIHNFLFSAYFETLASSCIGFSVSMLQSITPTLIETIDLSEIFFSLSLPFRGRVRLRIYCLPRFRRFFLVQILLPGCLFDSCHNLSSETSMEARGRRAVENRC